MHDPSQDYITTFFRKQRDCVLGSGATRSRLAISEPAPLRDDDPARASAIPCGLGGCPLILKVQPGAFFRYAARSHGRDGLVIAPTDRSGQRVRSELPSVATSGRDSVLVGRKPHAGRSRGDHDRAHARARTLCVQAAP